MKNTMKKAGYYFCFLILIILLIGCEKKEEAKTAEIYAMDTVMQITVYGEEKEEAVKEARKLIQKYDALWSSDGTNSDIRKINECAGDFVTVAPETYELLRKSIAISEMTEGAFDVSIEPVVSLWGFDNKDYRIPDVTEREKAVKYVDYRKIIMRDNNQIKIEKGMKIGVGGIAKGYTSNKLMEAFRSMKVSAAIVSLGGNVETFGKKNTGELFRVGITNPLSSDSLLGTIDLTDKAVITSGNYERYFEKDGVHYHHIIDRKTAAPAENDLSSVTVIGEDGTMCDGLSTALFVMGKERALTFQKEHTEYDIILVTKNGDVISTAKEFVLM